MGVNNEVTAKIQNAFRQIYQDHVQIVQETIACADQRLQDSGLVDQRLQQVDADFSSTCAQSSALEQHVRALDESILGLDPPHDLRTALDESILATSLCVNDLRAHQVYLDESQQTATLAGYPVGSVVTAARDLMVGGNLAVKSGTRGRVMAMHETTVDGDIAVNWDATEDGKHKTTKVTPGRDCSLAEAGGVDQLHGALQLKTDQHESEMSQSMVASLTTGAETA